MWANSTECDVPAALARPVQLILRDRYGTDIDTLDIMGPNFEGEGVTLLSGYSGFYHAPRTQVDESHAYQEGAQPSPYPRVEMRRGKFVLGTQAPDPGLWEDIETRLWRFLRFDQDCYLRVYSVRSGWRELPIRLYDKPDDQLTYVPGVLRFGVWEIPYVAYDVWWRSPILQYGIRKGDLTEEVNTTTGAVQAGTGVWQGHVPMLNPADQRCWPEYASNEIEATTTVWLPDALTGRMVPLPALGAGKEFLVQTHPLRETLLTRDDSQEWANMEAQEFVSWIKPGKVTPVQVPIWIQGGTADTEVTAYYPQKWDRGWGGESTPALEDVEWAGASLA